MTRVPAYKRAGIATVLQRPGMFPKTTPRKNLQMVVESHKSRLKTEFNKIEQILELVNLTHLADAKVDSFSGWRDSPRRARSCPSRRSDFLDSRRSFERGRRTSSQTHIARNR